MQNEQNVPDRFSGTLDRRPGNGKHSGGGDPTPLVRQPLYISGLHIVPRIHPSSPDNFCMDIPLLFAHISLLTGQAK